MSTPTRKTNRKGTPTQSATYDQCQTPPYALTPLLPYIPTENVIWESASGDGLLARALNAFGYSIVATDILSGFNFFDDWTPEYDVQITNPPHSVKYKWLEHSCEIGKAFALLMPVEMMGAAKGQRLMEKYDIEVILLDARVDFKMPLKGWLGKGAQFPVAWYTRHLDLGSQIVYGKIDRKNKKDFHEAMRSKND